MRRVIQAPDGSLRILIANERQRRSGEKDADFYPRIFDVMARKMGLLALPFADVPDDAVPTDRSQRHKWRLQGGRVVVDPMVPDPVRPPTLAQRVAAIERRLGL